MPSSSAETSITDVNVRTVATLFGPPSLVRHRSGDAPTPVLGAGKPLVLLARLILDRKPITREATMVFLWPEMPELRARASLRQALHLLRQALGPDVLRSDRNTIALAPGLWSDVDAFLQSVADDDDEAATRHYGGIFLENLSVIDSSDAEQWIEFERRRLSRLFQDAAFRRISFLTASPHVQHAAALARRLRDTDPTIARFWRPLITALKASGDRRGLATERTALRARIDADLIDDPDAAMVIAGPASVEDDIAMTAESATPEHRAFNGSPKEPLSFFGRESELSYLADISARASTGRAERCLIVAPDAAGKSALLREFARRLTDIRTTVIAVGAERWMRDDPMSYVSNLIERLVEMPAAINLSRQSATILAAITPTVRQRLPADQCAPEHRRPQAVASALREVLIELAAEGVVVLLLDDLHAADADSLLVLGTVLDAPQAFPVFMLGSAQRRIDPVLTDWPVCTITPFSHEYTALQLARATGVRVSPDVVEPIHRAAAGSPLSAWQIVRSLVECGHVRITNDLAEWATEPHVFIDPREVFPARVARRAGAEREVLDILAVAGCACSLATLTELLPTITSVPSIVHALTAADLLDHVESESVRITHDRITAAVLRAMTIENRQAIARRVGLALATRASTLHEMRRVLQLLTVAESPADAAKVIDRWGTQFASNTTVTSAITETLRSTVRVAPPPPTIQHSYRATATVAAVLAALVVALLAWRW
jgi:DNA-binding SARP family transcriptional activator